MKKGGRIDLPPFLFRESSYRNFVIKSTAINQGLYLFTINGHNMGRR